MAKNAKELLVLTTAAATSYGGYIFYDKMIRSASSNQVTSDHNADTQVKDQDLVVNKDVLEKIVKMEKEKTRLEKLRSLWFYPYGNPVDKKKDPPLTVPGDAGYKEEQRQKSDGEES